MQALVLKEPKPGYAGVTLQNVEPPARGGLRIGVRAAAVTFVDLLMTSGGYQYKPPLPYILGSDFAGEVLEGGDGYAAGDAVMGMTRGGAFAEEVRVPGDAVLPKPAGWSMGEAAAFGQSYLTAYVALTRHAHLQAGEWLLVHGASGGVGFAAVDLGKRIGAKVIAASASDEKLAKIDALYAPEAVINVRGGFREQVKQLTGSGAHVVYDPVGGDVFMESLRCTAYHGRVLIIGFASGTIPRVDMNYPLIKGLQLIGVRAGEYGRRFPDHAMEDRAALAALAQQEKAAPCVHAEYPLADWRAAFAAMDQRDVIGRVVLTP